MSTKEECLLQALEQTKQKLKIAESALEDIINWNETIEEKWEDPGERASYALDKIMLLDGF